MSNFIAKLGVNPYWIALNAHFWFAAFITLCAKGDVLAFCAIVIAAAIKEFWFDATYEVPTQTEIDNVTDFAGYVLGAAFGCFIASAIMVNYA